MTSFGYEHYDMTPIADLHSLQNNVGYYALLNNHTSLNPGSGLMMCVIIFFV